MIYNRIDNLKSKLDSHRPLPKEVVQNLHEDLILRWTYNSNAIEGNTLTLKETKVALEGITIGGKTMREHFEAINHKEAILFVEDLVSGKKPLTEWQVKSIHQLILKNIDNVNAGVYRKSNVIITGAEHRPPDFTSVESEMNEFIKWYSEKTINMHPIERACRVHADFVGIHPFVDGNGRTARLLMNLELMKDGYPPAVLPVENRLEYYETLDRIHTTNDYEPFIKLMIEVIEKAFLPYWYALGVKT
jgi:Fic family protein